MSFITGHWTRTTRYICPRIKKNCYIRLCLHSSIYKYKPISTNLGNSEYEYKISDEFDYGSSHTRSVSVICPWIEKLNFSSLFGIYLLC